MQLDLIGDEPLPRVGVGNATFLADVAEGVPVPELRNRVKAKRYPDLNAAWARDNLAFHGRTTTTTGA